MSSKDSSVDIAGIRIDRVTTIEVLQRIKQAIESGKRLIISTPNSEFLLRGLDNPSYRDLINSSDINVADGSGVQWAANFLARTKRPLAISYLQALGEGFAIFFSPRRAYRIIPERIPGSRLLWDIASYSSKNGYRIYLLGGADGVAQQTAQRLQDRYPKLVVAGTAGGKRSGQEERQQAAIKKSDADIVFVAFGSPYQEEWITKAKSALPTGVFLGVGGTFDFIVGGKAVNAGRLAQLFPARPTPAWIERSGLSFLWRLLTQPWRLGRVWRAFPYFMYRVVQYKNHS